MNPEEYLTIGEVAARLKVKPKTIKNKMAAGTFTKGVHYFSPKGLRPRFKWSAVQAWLEGRGGEPNEGSSTAIPMARGYSLGGTALTAKEVGSIEHSDGMQSKS